MIAIPLSGWAMVSGGQKPLEYFGLFPVAKLPVTKALAEAGHESHEVLAFLFLALLALHLAGALKHRLIDKDGTLQRMM
ncbi:cytochrome b [Novosphingobium colocasiae]